MKRQLHRLMAGALAAIMAAAALCGCGGGAGFEDPAGIEGVRVTISGGSGSRIGIASQFKDFSGSMDAMAGTCAITYSPATDVNGVPVVELTDDGWEASCIAAGKSPNKCIACRTIVDITGSRCTAHCEGMVPNSPIYEEDSVLMQLHFYTEFLTLYSSDPAETLFRQDGLRANVTGEPWLEADAGLDDLIDAGGASYVICDGTGGTMSMTAADPFSADPLNRDFIDPVSGLDDRTWRKNFTTAGLGNGYCVVETVIDAGVRLEGVSGGGSAIFTRDPIMLNSTWCNDRYSCQALGSSGTWDADQMVFRDADAVEFFDSSVGVDISSITGHYPHDMNGYQVNEANIRLMALELAEGQSQPELLNLGYAKPPDSYFHFDVESPHSYQMQGMALIMTNQVTTDNLRQDEPVVLFFTPVCALSDEFYSEAAIDACYDVTAESNVDRDVSSGALNLSRAASGSASFDMRKPVSEAAVYQAELDLRVDGMSLMGDSVIVAMANADGEGYYVDLNMHEEWKGYDLTCTTYVLEMIGGNLTCIQYYTLDCSAGVGEPITLRLEPYSGWYKASVKLGAGEFQTIADNLYNKYYTDLYLHATAAVADGSSMQVDLERLGAIGLTGRDDAVGPSGIDSTGYMLEPLPVW